MLDVVLQIAVCSPHRTLEPRWNKDSDRNHAVGVHVHEAKDFRFWEADGVKYGAGFEIDSVWKFDHELHAECPLANLVALGQTEFGIYLAADCPDRAVADDGERGLDVHAGSEASAGIAVCVGALVGETNAGESFVVEEWSADRSSRPD